MVCFRLNSSKRMFKKNKRSAGFGHCDQKQKQKQNQIENWLFLNKFMFPFDLLAFVCICVLAWFISFFLTTLPSITMESNGFGTFSMFRLNVSYRQKNRYFSVASFSLSEGSRDEPTQQQHRRRRRCCRCLTHSQSTHHLSEQSACARSVLLLFAR